MSEIMFSPVTQLLCNNPPGVLVTGRPGGGKTYALLNMAAECIDMGCSIFCLDAKNDMLALKNISPSIQITDVNKISPGSLDPFLIFDDIDSSIIITIIEILCGNLDSNQKLAITPVIGDFVKRVRTTNGSVSFRDFADYLYSNQNVYAQAIGNQLLLNANTKYGPLLFGMPGRKSKGIKLGMENRIISVFGMQLPSGSEIPKPDELVSAAVVYIICKMMKDILTRNSKQTSGNKLALGKKEDKSSRRPTVIFLDECHMLMRSKAVKDIIDEILVLGRSLNTAIVLASQNVTHFDEKIAQHIATKITFAMSKREAQEFFSLFDNTSSDNMLDTQECIETTTILKTGYCYFIDRKERCVLLHVESPYDNGDLTSNPLFKKER